MIIVEGPDGGGKTTLVKRLCEDLGVGVMPRPCSSDRGVDTKSLRYWVADDLSYPQGQKTGKLYDRHPLISEPIYGLVVRGHMADGFATPDWSAMMLERLYSFNPLIIFCLPPLKVVKENVTATHENHTKHLRGVHTGIEAIWSLYSFRLAQEFTRSVMTTIHWNYTYENSELIYQQGILPRAKEHTSNA